MKIRYFAQGLSYLYKHIPKKNQKKYPGSFGLERTKYLLKLLGNPQEKIKVIHVAGTSGKGSTSYLISLFLNSLGFKTGLHTSPHLTDIRERFVVGGVMITKKEFVRYLRQIIPSVEKVKSGQFKSPTYFEILVSLAYYIFYQRKVDYAVIETGLGGLLDGTNVVQNKNKISVITRIGYDHTEILGNTLQEIAYQKAGIINSESQVLTVKQEPAAMSAIKQIVKKKSAKLYILNERESIKVDESGTTFDFEFAGFKIKKLHLKLIGSHQAENCGLALATICLLNHNKVHPPSELEIRKAAQTAFFPGRFEIRKIRKKTIIIDGAHNPQKMQTLIRNLKHIFPKTEFAFLLAFKNDKDVSEIMRLICPIAQKIIFTSFFAKTHDWKHKSYDPDKLGLICKNLGFKNYQIIKDSQKALKAGLNDKSNILVVTGSFYLIGELYSQLKAAKIL